MNPNKKNIFKTYLEPPDGGLTPGDDPVDFPLKRANISSLSSFFPDACSLNIDSDFWIYLTQPLTFEPSVGDACYLSDSLEFPILGDNRYYKLKLTTSSNTYLAQINNSGIITILVLCVLI
jgi:hypothetical protein